MKIALFGATGNIGQRIMKEALRRGHEVKAIVRAPARITEQNANLSVVTADYFNVDEIVSKVAGNDVVISAYGGTRGQKVDYVGFGKVLVDGVKRAGVQRLLVVGGAGSLEIAPGLQAVDAPDFPEIYKPDALAQREALAFYRNVEGLDWTYFSPAGIIAPGERTGQYRTDTEKMVTNNQGESRISYEDYAVAMLDEVEAPKFIRKRFTAAY